MSKICSKCKTERESSEFSKAQSQKDGLQCWCKECKGKEQRGYRQTERGKEARRKYQKSESGKESNRRNTRNQRRLCPEKTKARRILNKAIRDGRIIRPSNCESCFKKRFVQAHHEDYSKPLDVDWLCNKCHNELWKNYKLNMKGLKMGENNKSQLTTEEELKELLLSSTGEDDEVDRFVGLIIDLIAERSEDVAEEVVDKHERDYDHDRIR